MVIHLDVAPSDLSNIMSRLSKTPSYVTQEVYIFYDCTFYASLTVPRFITAVDPELHLINSPVSVMSRLSNLHTASSKHSKPTASRLSRTWRTRDGHWEGLRPIHSSRITILSEINPRFLNLRPQTCTLLLMSSCCMSHT